MADDPDGQPADRQLLETARRRMKDEAGRAAFDRFIERHRAFAVNVAYGYVVDRERAQDFAQEAFLRLYEALPRYKPTGPPRGLLARIIRNLCINHLKREKRVVRLEDFPAGAALLPSGGDQPDRELERRQSAARMAGALDGLKPLQQEAVKLRYFQDCSYQEIAVTLEISVNYVGVALHQALQALREALEEP